LNGTDRGQSAPPTHRRDRRTAPARGDQLGLLLAGAAFALLLLALTLYVDLHATALGTGTATP